MDRRNFIKNSVFTGIASGAALAFGSAGNLLAQSKSSPGTGFDMVAVKGGEPAQMFDLAIKELGGMSKFVKRGQKVLVKPNIGWDVSPEKAGNTNPLLVKRIIEQCYQAGAKEVVVFDNTCDKWTSCYQNSGIEKAVKDAGGKIAPGNTEGYYQNVEIKGGKRLKSTKVHELVLESDVFINVPILKNHSSTRLTIAMKNMMGVVWDRGYWHRNDLHQCIADYMLYSKKPTLNIVDAYRVLMKNGPRGVSVEDVSLMKNLLISTDFVAIDAAAAKIYGSEPADIPYIKLADSMGLGQMDLTKLNIKRIKV